MQVVDKGPFAIIDKAFEGISSCYLLPYSFFISWQGVLTLAYSGFPQPLLNLKQQLQLLCETLPPENPGSKWPKTTLGATNKISPNKIQQQTSTNQDHKTIGLRENSPLYMTRKSKQQKGKKTE
eukprot:TRINITY_DN6867_c0_g1_i11.p3 TRINITY_DN6867_c0_g1~~TRINITY_DN6867_c0_g1_i11.p3  ORF type:complete len:124 (-),score=5.17 TRINITY_DN6867_c0_g1_i11:46-417(-)